MKKLISIAVAAAFAATSLGALAQGNKDVKSGGGVAKSGDKSQTVTTATAKPKDKGEGKMPEHQGKRKTEKQRTDKK